MKICSVEECQKKTTSRNLCSAHYGKWWKYGDPLAGKTYGKVLNPIEKFKATPTVRIGECDEWPLERGRGGYGVVRSADRRKHMAHRLAWETANGHIPEGMFIDHICHNRACVKIEHLRLATTKQNAENLGAVRAASGYRGVDKHRNRWRARLKHNGRNIHVGTFDTAEEADQAVRAARNSLFTHNNLDRE